MHFEILVEDLSGKRMLDILLKKIIPDYDNNCRIIHYDGIGHFPKKSKTQKSIKKSRQLLPNLESMLKAYGKTHQYASTAVIVVCDLDDKCLKAFREELFNILDRCDPQPITRFCIAIEEGEAWFLGDIPAIKKAYPKSKNKILKSYRQDSICGTWEKLADAIHPGGSKALPKGPIAGREKSKWAENITPHMDVQSNQSPSFCYFRDTLRKLIEQAAE